MILLFIAPPCPLSAQLTATGDFITRGEYINLHRTVPDSIKHQTFNFLCSAEVDLGYTHKSSSAYLALLATYTSGPNLFSEGRIRAWSANAAEAWFRYQFTDRFSIQAGRIEISYEDEQFFEARDWDNLVTSHNSIIGHWLDPDSAFMADLGVAANGFSGAGSGFNTNTTVNNYRYMAYFYGHRKFLDDQLMLTLSDIFNASDNGIERSLLYGRNTGGLTVWLSWPSWDMSLTGFYQSGHITDGRNLSALYYSGYFGYKPAEWLQLLISYEHMSGDDYSDTTWKKTVHGFSLLYGNTRKSLGLSGIFDSPYRSNNNPGLNNLGLKATIDIGSKLSVEPGYHWFTVPNNYILTFDPVTRKRTPEKIPSSLLHEFDLLFKYTPSKQWEISLNYSALIPGRSVKEISGWNFSTHGFLSSSYIEVEFTPDLLKAGVHKQSP
ncbi:MAG: alginate export family protein [Bacteroidota bacterium]